MLTYCAFVVVLLALLFGFANVTYLTSVHDIQIFLDHRWYEWKIGRCEANEEVSSSINGFSNVSGEIHVVYAAAASEFPGLMSSMLSLSLNLESPSNCVIHVLVDAAHVYQANRLIDCFRGEFDNPAKVPTVRIHTMESVPLNLTEFAEVWEDWWPGGVTLLTPLSFAQVYLPEYLPEASRVVWLDADTIVKTDVSKLYRIPMKHALAAALDMRWVTWRTGYLADMDQLNSTWWRDLKDLDARTLNSGVLVIDLERWRKENITSRLEAWVKRASGIKTTQLALNLEFETKFDVIDSRWNVMGLMAVPPQRCLDNAHILHWAETIRPWSPRVPNMSSRLQSLYRTLTGDFKPAKRCDWSDDMLDSDIDIVF
eukprot:TRINITY_DN46025_c0_g1_i1.p1 TRINITY_DN46025_c0_g1~~TRINITY_DN46025_c0_g1_i1.p1  ORF type:complete len:370 (-),score=33.40 TRINITY_DN46025_c0_g1_i1:169-1278(-)